MALRAGSLGTEAGHPPMRTGLGPREVRLAISAGSHGASVGGGAEAAAVPLGAPGTAGGRRPRHPPQGPQPGRRGSLKILFTK